VKPVNALIIDDSEIDRYILKRQLNGIGVNNVFENDDGATALEFLKNYDKNRESHPDKFPPVVIFLDINMPLIDGFQFLQEFSELRKKFDYSQCTVLMYSSSERVEDIERASKYGFVADFIVKGETPVEVLKEKIAFLID
jgi:CheY-like chemotaxis protein